MKKLLSLFGFVLLATGLATAQLRYEINPYGGYRIGGDFKFTVFDTDITHEIDLESGPEFGLNASVGLSPGFYVELQWARQNTTLKPKRVIDLEMQPMLDITVDYYHLAFLFQYAYDRLQPFGYFGLGWTGFYPADPFNSQTKFSMSGGGGIKYYITRSFGLRAQARFITSSMNSESGDIWCDFYGCWSTTRINWLTQWSFTGGLIFRFGSKGRRF